MSNNSTNVRIAGSLLSALGTVSPEAAGRLAFGLFCTPRGRRLPGFSPPPDAVERFPVGRGRLTSYVWAGGGPTVVLVHGWNGVASSLAPFIAPLRDAGRRVVALDLPAHGRSSGRRTTLPMAVEAVNAAVRREPEVEAVIAHSFGVPATVLAAGLGAPVPRAVLVSGPASMDPYLQQFEVALGLSPAVRAALRARVRRVLDAGGLDTMELTQVAPRLATRALVVHDREDRDVPFLSAQALVRAWPGAELMATEGLGHRRILGDPAVVDRAVRFAVGWDGPAAETPDAPAARQLRVVGA